MKPWAIILVASAALAAAKPTVYLIRHGEKPADGGDGLSEKGKQRAQCLRQVFGAGSPYNIGYIMAQTPKAGTFTAVSHFRLNGSTDSACFLREMQTAAARGLATR